MDTQNSIVVTHVPRLNDLVVEIVFVDVLVREAARLRRKHERVEDVWWKDYGWVEVE